MSRDARLSALMAPLVTTVSAVLRLVGILMFRVEDGTAQLEQFLALAEPGATVTNRRGLIAVRVGQGRARCRCILAAAGDGGADARVVLGFATSRSAAS